MSNREYRPFVSRPEIKITTVISASCTCRVPSGLLALTNGAQSPRGSNRNERALLGLSPRGHLSIRSSIPSASAASNRRPATDRDQFRMLSKRCRHEEEISGNAAADLLCLPCLSLCDLDSPSGDETNVTYWNL